MENQTTKCVVETLNKIEDALGKELFASIFQLIVTDNGSEFTDIDGMENPVSMTRNEQNLFL